MENIQVLQIVIGVILGGIIVYLYFNNKKSVSTGADNSENTISKDLYDVEKERLISVENEMKKKENLIIDLKSDIAKKDENLSNLNERLDEEKKRLKEQHDQLKTEFENLANEILDKKSEKFVKQNKENLDKILDPLGEKIKSFEKSVQEKYENELKGRSGLEEQIKLLTELNKQISQDAVNLTHALKGDSKTQGDWGEFQLEVLLEKSGLEKGLHFEMQTSFEDEDGNRKQPDCVVNLPEDRNLIIDSKVSLTAYEQFVNTETEDEIPLYLKKHNDSVKTHIKELAGKEYSKLYNINTPNFVLMFVPIESAMTLAFQNDRELYNFAYSKNIILVSTSTLMAIMSTVSYMWTQENQKKNVLEIARQSGALYDKFTNFIEDLKSIGKYLDQSGRKYDDAMNKLTSGKGNLVKRAETIKKLGAKTSKSLPQELVDKSEIEFLEEATVTDE
jgi:DNA recombination protein RmuC